MGFPFKKRQAFSLGRESQPQPLSGFPQKQFSEVWSLRTGAGRIALCDLGVTGITASPGECDFSGLISQLARDTCILPAKLSLVHRIPELIPGRGSAPRSQGVLWRRVAERRRCSSSRSFLTRLDKWTRCAVSVFYSQERQNPQPGSNSVGSLQMAGFFGLCSACDRRT